MKKNSIKVFIEYMIGLLDLEKSRVKKEKYIFFIEHWHIDKFNPLLWVKLPGKKIGTKNNKGKKLFKRKKSFF